jgi:hypothetical protein
MRKMFAILSITAVLAVVSGCGDGNTTTPPATPPPAGTTDGAATPVTTPDGAADR